jgi:hypothetical protein
MSVGISKAKALNQFATSESNVLFLARHIEFAHPQMPATTHTTTDHIYHIIGNPRLFEPICLDVKHNLA